MKPIPEEVLMKIEVEECGEPLVDPSKHDERIITVGHGESSLVRKAVAEMLSAVQDSLPKGLRLKVHEGFRSLAVQRKLYGEIFEKLKVENPEWTKEQVEEETDKWVANPAKVTLHTTGGAVDLALADLSGQELDMGSPINSIGESSVTDFGSLKDEQRKNRDVLATCMKKVGFVNYPLEWWHWSYGESYWAASLNRKAIYDVLDQPS